MGSSPGLSSLPMMGGSGGHKEALDAHGSCGRCVLSVATFNIHGSRIWDVGCSYTIKESPELGNIK